MRIAESEIIINDDGSAFHIHLKPEELADIVILVGDPGRVDMVAGFLTDIEFRHQSREFVSTTGKYNGKRVTVLSTGIGTDNIDIVMTELDALANIDFETREVKDVHRTLNIVRLGTCGAIQPTQTVCDNCGHKTFKYKNAEEEILQEDLLETHNPYEAGETDNPDAENVTTVFASAGTKIPFYRIRQLPFVPRPAVSRMDSIYGMSEVKMILEEQDAVNKLLTKGLDKGMKSGTVITKPKTISLGDMDDTVKIVGVRTVEEAQMVQAKQLTSDTSQDLVLSNLFYESARSASGVTESFQGKSDSTAVSGKAKMYAAAQSAGRIQSLREMKAAAFAGVYELVLKYLLAFSNEPIKFTRTLPNGDVSEVEWNKYMFLAKGPYGEYYYRDDFQFNTDAASTLSQDRAAMWQETDNKFIQGMFGNPADPTTLVLYWNIMKGLGYPLAKTALASVQQRERHLPPEMEQAIMQNPDVMQTVQAMLTGNAEVVPKEQTKKESK